MLVEIRVTLGEVRRHRPALLGLEGAIEENDFRDIAVEEAGDKGRLAGVAVGAGPQGDLLHAQLGRRAFPRPLRLAVERDRDPSRLAANFNDMGTAERMRAAQQVDRAAEATALDV